MACTSLKKERFPLFYVMKLDLCTGLLAMSVFSVGLRGLRIVPGLNFTASDLLLFLGLLLMILQKKKLNIGPWPYMAESFIWSTGSMLLVFGIVVSSLINGNELNGVILAVQYFYAYFVAVLVVNNASGMQYKSVVKALLFGLMFICVGGLVSVYLGVNIPLVYVSQRGRLASFLGNPNALARFVGLCFPIILYCCITGFLGKRMQWLFLLVVTLTIMHTASFGGLATFLFGALVTIVMLPGTRSKLKWIVISILGLCLLISMFGVPAIIQDRVLPALMSLNVSEAGSLEERLSIALEATEIIARYPIFGIGGDAYAEKRSLWFTVHNTYLLIWAEGGLFAFLGWMLLHITMFFNCLRLVMDRRTRIEGASAMGTFGAFIISNFTSTHAYSLYIVLPLVIALFLPKSRTTVTDEIHSSRV